MLQPDRSTEIPELTRLVAQAAFPNGSIFMTIRDELGPVFEDEAFADLYPSLGQPAESLARTHLQHVATAAAINVVRIVDWLNGGRPADTPVSPFLALALQTA